NPDYIFLPRVSKTEVLIEVTALSDKTADTKNPVADFSGKLMHIAVKREITPQPGAFDCQLGNVEKDDQIVLGVPERRDMDAFFKGREFLSFLSAIEAAPTEGRVFRFVGRGAESVITFEPGKQFFGG